MGRVHKKEVILQAAGELFRVKGYHGTTIRDISEASGMLSGSLYAHIRSKEDLLFEITLRGAEKFLSSLGPIVRVDEESTVKLQQAMEAHVKVITSNLEVATVFLHEWKALTNNRRQLIKEKRDQYEQLWAQLLQEGMATGCFQVVDEKYTRLFILSSLNGVYQWYRPDGKESPEEVAARFASILLSGLKLTKGGA